MGKKKHYDKSYGKCYCWGYKKYDCEIDFKKHDYDDKKHYDKYDYDYKKYKKHNHGYRSKHDWEKSKKCDCGHKY